MARPLIMTPDRPDMAGHSEMSGSMRGGHISRTRPDIPQGVSPLRGNPACPVCPDGGTGAATIHELARRVARLAPCHRDPERFHIEKSEIVHALRRLAHG